MQKLIRTTLFAAALLLFGVSTAPAQMFELEADSTSLDPGNGNSDARCLVQLSSGEFVFFNGADGGIFIWDGSSLVEHRSASDLNSDVPGESNNFNQCDGVAVGNGFVYFILRSDETNDNYLYRTEAADPSNNASKQFTGANALAVAENTLYLGGIADFGAPGNGIFQIANDLSGSVSEVATNSDVNPSALSLDGSGTLYGYSSTFGAGDFEATLFTLDVTASSPSFSVFADPYKSSSPFNNTGNEISDLEFLTFSGTDFLVAYNDAFDGPNGPEWGTVRISDQTIDLLFTSADLTADLSVDEYAGVYPITVTDGGEVYTASTIEFSSSPYIAKVSNAPPLPVEMAGFDAVKNGSSVELTWQTASETNNTGFNVQHQTESGWRTLGFVESKVDGGTTTEAQSYRYTVKQELDPGTHRFRLQQKDLDGSTSLSDVETVDVGLDAALTLQAPMPNPTRGQATVKFGMKEATETSVAVYNVLGQRVKTLYQGTPQAGEMADVTFNAGTLPSGVYFVRLRADGQTRTERLTVVQ